MSFRPVLRDPTLPHQIVIGQLGCELTVSCNCLREATRPNVRAGLIDVRPRYEPGEAMAIWEDWHRKMKKPAGSG